MSNAERQKRYRDGKRNAQQAESVTRVTVDAARNARTRTVAIPGDADYVGCCRQADGVWQVDNTKPSVKDMPTNELIRRLHYIKDWQRSPEHLEVLRRRREAAA